jgi:hypothetical protein
MRRWNAIANGDFNGDGTDDVMWRNADEITAAWTKDGQIFKPSYGSTTGWNVSRPGFQPRRRDRYHVGEHVNGSCCYMAV